MDILSETGYVVYSIIQLKSIESESTAATATGAIFFVRLSPTPPVLIVFL